MSLVRQKKRDLTLGVRDPRRAGRCGMRTKYSVLSIYAGLAISPTPYPSSDIESLPQYAPSQYPHYQPSRR